MNGFNMVVLCFSLLLISCANDHNSSGKTSATDKASLNNELDSMAKVEAEKMLEPLEFVRLSNDNVEEYLTEFAKSDPRDKVLITTPFGDIKVKLYKNTPLHRASFLHLIEERYFKYVELTRVHKTHVIQGGNSQEEAKATERFLLGNYTIPNELSAGYIHKKGALAMARVTENNPEKRSSPYDFYIVHGRKSSGPELFNVQKTNGVKYSDSQKSLYKTLGGIPPLDGEYTVFGEVTSGMDVLEEIVNVPIDSKYWPKDDILISMEIID
ncbi:MAG: peptidylprolyl isomerase [Flavobacteriales bacterium]